MADRLPVRQAVAALLSIVSIVPALIVSTYFFAPGLAGALMPYSIPAYALTLCSVALGCTAAAFASTRWSIIGLIGATLGVVITTVLGLYIWASSASDLAWESPVPLPAFVIIALSINWAALAAQFAGRRRSAWRLRGVALARLGAGWMVANTLLALWPDQ